MPRNRILLFAGLCALATSCSDTQDDALEAGVGPAGHKDASVQTITTTHYFNSYGWNGPTTAQGISKVGEHHETLTAVNVKCFESSNTCYAVNGSIVTVYEDENASGQSQSFTLQKKQP